MLDITDKYPTMRSARAEVRMRAALSTIQAIRERRVPKGDPFEVARAAAALAAKHTPDIIPYCHPIPITAVGVEFDIDEADIIVTAVVRAIAPTGVEMEALTAVSAAMLTVYDMLKMIDQSLEILSIRLIEKRGGKGDYREIPERRLRGAVLVMSDTIAAGRKSDLSGRMIKERMEAEGFEVVDYKVIPDDTEKIVHLLENYADNLNLDLVLTTGGTGFSLRDATPEAMARVIEREIPGIPESIRAYGQQRTPYAMLSRGRAGLRGSTLIVNLPGSKRGVAESLNFLFPAILHSFPMIWGRSGWERDKG